MKTKFNRVKRVMWISALILGPIFLSCNSNHSGNYEDLIKDGLYTIKVNCAGPAIGEFRADQPMSLEAGASPGEVNIGCVQLILYPQVLPCCR
jgi:hypothetical protein